MKFIYMLCFIGANILMDLHGDIKLADFGAAKLRVSSFVEKFICM